MTTSKLREQREGRTVERMLRLYCRGNHGKTPLCDSCKELLSYATQRRIACPHGINKTTCVRCTIRCYDPQHRQLIRQVMRYAGPRMIVRYPVDTIRHILQSVRR